ncbi:endonuclease/exonuclease/phosphatase family protein [Cellulomonas sp. SLBN-39]|uniref:endonuclease/exonuclease/phosphatase family protein n=1 Tax=Cellulomonas sp. SLBN-39 TaxID=2768446 RepID=UPI0011507167|nr:endonuclease/exonuclease/phosphatase family protein [Cellulomonas sp. SLBN-39]TQL03254.1 endonuclease/exonuclease/phosphatase family metal-dependent hydrolase [Cellulomonas sp. SLBN-39]
MTADEHPALRVMTYNVHGLRDPGVADVVRACRPDVLALQEPPRGPGGRARLLRFAGRTGMRLVVGGGGARTTALLVVAHRRVTDARAVRLPWRPGLTRRGASTALVDGVRVVVVHLGLRADERLRHVGRLGARVLRDATRADELVVVLGDLNERPGSPAWSALAESAALVDAAAEAGVDDPTYPADEPRVRIDAVLADPLLPVVGALVPADDPVARASDHRPLVVDLRLPDPPQG